MLQGEKWNADEDVMCNSDSEDLKKYTENYNCEIFVLLT